MRILHLDAGKELRGGQHQVLRLIAGLAAAGVESTLLARADAPLYEEARKAGWCVEPIGFTRAVMLSRRNDLIHAHDSHSHNLGAVVRGKPLVVARRVSFPIGSKWKYSTATHYIAVSEFVKSVLMEGGVREDKISVVYDGVPVLDVATPSRIIAPGNVHDPQKGAGLAMEAAKLAGVTLHFSADLENDLRHASLLVYVTYSEGLGSGALLAMSAAVPVIASNVGGLAEIIQPDQNGVLVENRPEEIAAAIRRLLDNPEMARTIGRTGRQTVIDKFTVDQMVRRTIEVYRQVLY